MKKDEQLILAMATTVKHTLLLLIYLWLASRASGATWYASVNGNSALGTRANPWSIPFAVAPTNNSLEPGDTVILLASVTPYVCAGSNVAFDAYSMLEFGKSGTPSDKITYQAERLHQFSFDGGLGLLTASNIVIRDCRIFYSGSTQRQRSNTTTHPPGINELTSGNKILHNLIENTGHPGIASWSTTKGKHIAGNIIRFTGYNDWTEKPPPFEGQFWEGAERGSGTYNQNDDNSSEALFRGNIIYHVYTTCHNDYGNTDIWGFRHVNEILQGAPAGAYFYHQDNDGSEGLHFDTNFIWSTLPIRIGYPLGNGGHSNAVVRGNYAVGDGFTFYQVDGWRNNTWSNNFGVRLDARYPWQLEVSGETSGDTTSHHINDNTYWAVNSGAIGADPFFIEETGYSFANWKTETTEDGNSSYTQGLPTGMFISAFRPSDDERFTHIVVFNWDEDASVTTNLSTHGFVTAGSRIAIYDAQNIPTAFTNYVYTGGEVLLPLDLTDKATMLGEFTDPAHPWDGFDSRFRAFVVFHDDSGGTLLTGNSLLEGKFLLR